MRSVVKICLKIFFALFFGALILYLLFRNTDLTAFNSMLKEVNISWLVLVFLGFFLTFLSRTFRLRIVFKKNSYALFNIVVVHNFINRLLPLRLGEFSLPYLMKRYLDVNFMDGLGMLFLIRFIDIFVIVFLATVSIVTCMSEIATSTLVTCLMVGLVLQVLIIFKLDLLVRLMIRITAAVRIAYMRDKISAFAEKLDKLLIVLKKKDINALMLKILLFSFGNWLFTYLIYYGFIKMFNLQYTYFEVIMASSVVTLAGHIVVNNVAQLGTFELGFVLGFVFLAGMSRDVAVPLALFVNISCMIVTTAGAALSYPPLVVCDGIRGRKSG